MYPTKEDIQFFYEMDIYTTADIESFVKQGCLTEEEFKKITGKPFSES
ncbi:XkdX family protein [Enterococcus faecalis]|nr:XkdX family protein [Enterococcus faecalis]MBD9891143.1 XkdX family protein [Enterococcus faecalis]MDR0026346.1 XkdX family protein [Enterococcus faecalis]